MDKAALGQCGLAPPRESAVDSWCVTNSLSLTTPTTPPYPLLQYLSDLEEISQILGTVQLCPEVLRHLKTPAMPL